MLGFAALGQIALGQSQTSDSSVTLVIEAGAIALTGHDVGITIARVVQADAGAFALSGQDAGFVYSTVVTADGAAITLTGHDAIIRVARMIAADAGAVAMTGNVVEFTRRSKGLHVAPRGGAAQMRARSSGGSKGLRMRA